MPPLRREALERTNRKILEVLGDKSWSSSLNLIPADDKAIDSFDKLLDYVKMLKSQVHGLEETLRNVR